MSPLNGSESFSSSSVFVKSPSEEPLLFVSPVIVLEEEESVSLISLFDYFLVLH